MKRFPTLGLVAAAMTLPACDHLPTVPPDRVPPARGIVFVDWSAGGYSTTAAQVSLAALQATGANTLVLIVTAYQQDSRSNSIRRDDPRTPTPGAVGEAVRRALAGGMRVVLKPHVDVDDLSWRGSIRPDDAESWFRGYEDFILAWAVFAESSGIHQFVVGTELAGTLRHVERWLGTITKLRAAFSGELTYAASWDEAALVPFWGRLDYVGIDFYFPVATRSNPSRFEILAAWQPWLDRLELLHRQTDRQVLLTEIGYRSVDGAGLEPFAFASELPLDVREQADLYWAALHATSDRSWLVGMYWWNWPADGTGGPANRDYTPHGKPAAGELAGAWR